jgi:HEAT repeat protein
MLALLLLLAQDIGAVLDGWKSDDPAARDKASETVLSMWKSADLDALDAAAKSADPELSRRAADAVLRIRLRRRVSADLHETLPDFDARLLFGSAEDRVKFVAAAIEAWNCDRIPASDLAILAETAVAQRLDFRTDALCDLLESERIGSLAPLLVPAVRSPHAPTRAMAAMALGNSGRPDLSSSLLPLLQDADREVRITVLTALSALGPAPFVREIREKLADADGTVRGWAVQILGDLDPQAHLEALRPLLKDPDEHPRLRVLSLMVHVGDPAARDTARAQLDDPSRLVRELALRHLARFGEPDDAIARHLDSPHDDLRETAISLLEGRADRAHAAAIAKKLKDPKSAVRIAAVHALQKLGAREFAADVAALLADVEVRERALSCLGAFRDPEMIGSILPLLSDDDQTIRQWALYNLALHDAARVNQAIVPMLSAAAPSARLSALHVLRKIGAADTARAVLPLLRDSDHEVRSAAARTLDHLTSDALLPDLVRLLQDKDAFVRRAALNAMPRTAVVSHLDAVTALLRDGDESVRASAVRALRLARAPADRIAPLLDDPSPLVRTAALESLGRNATAAQRLQALRDTAPEVRRLALTLGSDLPLEALRDAAADKDAGVRDLVARVLGRSGSSRDLEPLLRDAQWNVRRAAVESLRDRTRADLLRAALQDPSEEVRLAAIHAAGRLDLRSLAVDIVPLTRDRSFNVRRRAAAALGLLEAPVESLDRPLRSRWDDSRVLAVRALARLGRPERALPLLKDPSVDVRVAALRALSLDPRHADAARPLLDDEDDSVQAAAMLALAEMKETSDDTLRRLHVALSSDAPRLHTAAAVALARLGKSPVDATLVADVGTFTFPDLHESLLRILNRLDALDKPVKLEKPLVTLADFRDFLAPLGLKVADAGDFNCVDAPRTLTLRALLERAAAAHVIDGGTVHFHASTDHALRAWEVLLERK